MDHNNNLSPLIVVTVAFVINLGNRKQLRFVCNISVLNVLKVVLKCSEILFKSFLNPFKHLTTCTFLKNVLK